MRIFLFIAAIVSVCFADVWVRPYMKSDGTWVPGHWRSDPDGDKTNNWTASPNVNPYTGTPGTKTPSTGCEYKWVDGYTDDAGRYHPGHFGKVCD